MRIEVIPSNFKRTISFIIDILIFNLIAVLPLQIILGDMLPKEINDLERFVAQNTPFMFYIAIFLSIALLTYFTLFEYYLHQTPAKIFLKLRLTGDTVFWKILLSNISIIPVSPFTILGIIDFIYMLFSSRHIRLMEKLTKIEVVEELKDD